MAQQHDRKDTGVQTQGEHERKTRPISQPQRLPPYNIVLVNDDDHTYEYVIEMLGRLFGFSTEKAFQMAKEVDKTGRVILLTTTKEHAELKQEQIHAFGPDMRMELPAGSMTSVIEPAA